jgi:hypothetical protein
LTEWNPDNDDLPDAEDDDTEAKESEQDRWAELNARRAARYERTRPRGQLGRPFDWINAPEKRLALRALDYLADMPKLEHHELAALLGVREWQARHAVWALVGSGLLGQARGKWVVKREAVNTT